LAQQVACQTTTPKDNPATLVVPEKWITTILLGGKLPRKLQIERPQFAKVLEFLQQSIDAFSLVAASSLSFVPTD
jgi:hypothetical protein